MYKRRDFFYGGKNRVKTWNVQDGFDVFVKYDERTPASRVELEHKHDYVELVYIKCGEVTHFINNVSYKVSRGDLLFINYGETHSFSIDSDKVEYYNFYVKPEFIGANMISTENINDIFLALLPDGAAEIQKKRKTSCVRISGNERVEIELIAKKMYDECMKNEPCRDIVLNAYMRIVFSKLIRELLKDTGSERPNLLTEDILKYIDNNFTSSISATDLANHCFHNPAYLGRVFKSVYGKSLKAYIREKRMQYAYELICETDLSIEEIYRRVGYNCKTQFYKDFKGIYGGLPGAIRKKYSKDTNTTQADR